MSDIWLGVLLTVSFAISGLVLVLGPHACSTLHQDIKLLSLTAAGTGLLSAVFVGLALI